MSLSSSLTDIQLWSKYQPYVRETLTEWYGSYDEWVLAPWTDIFKTALDIYDYSLGNPQAAYVAGVYLGISIVEFAKSHGLADPQGIDSPSIVLFNAIRTYMSDPLLRQVMVMSYEDYISYNSNGTYGIRTTIEDYEKN